MKPIAIIPTLLTLGNGICGYVAIVVASKITPETRTLDADHYFALAGWFILFAMVFDMLDGYVARLSRTASAFGGQLDSLCDAASFGLAPAFIVLKIGPGWEPNAFVHQLLAGISALYFVCTVLRLARFNVDNSPEASSHKRFRGLPSPGAAGCIAALAILRGSLPARLLQYFSEGPAYDSAVATLYTSIQIAAPIGALVAALLMVSNVPYPHLTSRIFRGKRHIGHLVQVLMAGFLLMMLREIAPILIFWGYALLFPLRARLRPNLATQSESNSLHQ